MTKNGFALAVTGILIAVAGCDGPDTGTDLKKINVRTILMTFSWERESQILKSRIQRVWRMWLNPLTLSPSGCR